ncbi:MAG TPA: SDR family oxidoreductase [Holophagaceae bacterium]
MERNSGDGKPCWLLVGGRRRLGRALAEDLARDHHLVLTSSHAWGGEAWLEGLSGSTQIRTLHWDASDPELVSRMMADLGALESAGWAISGAVIVAGTFPEAPFGGWSAENLAETWQMNLSFPLLCAQALGPRLTDGACLQFLLDTSIHTPWLQRLPYSAAKGALASVLPGLARALAPRVRVVGHALGAILPAEGSDEAFLADRTLLKRLGEPADLCRAVRYAAASPFLTGEILTLDGGRRWI